MAICLVSRLLSRASLSIIVPVWLCFPCGGVRAADDGPTLLAKVGETYRHLTSFRFSGQLLIHSPLDSRDSADEFILVARSRPDRFRLQFGIGFGRILVTCDGSKTNIHVAETNQHVDRIATDVWAVMNQTLPPEVLRPVRQYAGFVDRFAGLPAGLGNPSIVRSGAKIQTPNAESICTVIEGEELASEGRPSKTRLWIDDRFIVLREERGLNQNGENPRSVLQLVSWDVDQNLPDALFAMPLPPDSRLTAHLDRPAEFVSSLNRAEGDLSKLTLLDLNGSPRRILDFSGKLVLLDFWATWCKPCLQQMDDLSKLYREYQQDGLVVVGITSEPALIVSRFFKNKTAPPYPLLIDDKKNLTQLLQVGALPTMFALDGDGRVSRHEIGRVERKKLDAMLKEFGITTDKEKP